MFSTLLVDLKWNPHIHCLVSEGGIGNSVSGAPKSISTIPFFVMHFVPHLILWKRNCVFLQSGKRVVTRNTTYFYVYANQTNATQIVTKYIGRYLGRPVIATSRIDHYDGETVTFHYNRHEDNRLITESVPVMQFIQRLIQIHP